MKTENQKSGHVIQKYIMNRISENEGTVLFSRDSMEVVMDEGGSYWLCDQGIRDEDDPEEKGCWKCGDTFVMKQTNTGSIPGKETKMEDLVENKQGPARPMIVVTDTEGSHWLCDESIDPKKGLKEQGCWQCGDEHFAFTRDD